MVRPNFRNLFFQNKRQNTISFEQINLEGAALSDRRLERAYMDNSKQLTQTTLNDPTNQREFSLSATTGDTKYSQISLAQTYNSAAEIVMLMQACIDSNINPSQVADHPNAYNDCANLDRYPIWYVNSGWLLYPSLIEIDKDSNWNCINENTFQEFVKDSVFKTQVNTDLCN